MRPSLYEFAGGDDAFLALARAHHARCVADSELNHPFSKEDLNPHHVERLAAYWAEVLGGPPRFSAELSDQMSSSAAAVCSCRCWRGGCDAGLPHSAPGRKVVGSGRELFADCLRRRGVAFSCCLSTWHATDSSLTCEPPSRESPSPCSDGDATVGSPKRSPDTSTNRNRRMRRRA